MIKPIGLGRASSEASLFSFSYIRKATNNTTIFQLLSLQEYGLNLQVSVTKVLDKYLKDGKEFAWKAPTSRSLIVTGNFFTASRGLL